MADKKPADDDALLKQARELFDKCKEAENDNREMALEDIKFAKLGEQWPDKIVAARQKEQRPCLTINKMPAFIRQVVNDARQNKPSIKVRPADSSGDPETAEIINGLIRNIEYTSNADVAYDTAIECAVTGGFGYVRVGLDYAHDDAFEMDLTIERVINPFSVYGDPNSTAADGSDWDVAFIIDRLPKADFKKKYKGKAETDFDSSAWEDAGTDWIDDETVTVAEWWQREEYDRTIVKLSDGRVFGKDQLESDPDLQLALMAGQIQIEAERVTKSCKVTQIIMSGVDILEKNDWPGRYIPIVPVYGDEFAVEGKRYYRSLINQAKDAQRMFNYWRTTSTELVALAPRVPFIGPKGAFDSDDRWNSANTSSHSYLEYDGPQAPMRQPLDVGPAGGALQEALNAADDMKAIIGMYDASLGARSNETSGKAIMARQREGDVSTFHFIDNLSRAIRALGRILIDLIPHVYDGPRVVRVIGEDGKEDIKHVNQEAEAKDKKGQPIVDEMGNAVMAMHDLTAGKYDLTVTTGPSFTTRREEAAMQITQMIQSYPPAAPILGPQLAKNMDWPGADEIAEKLEKLDPTNQPQIPPELQAQMEQGKQMIEQLTQENAQLKQDQQAEMAKVQQTAQADQAKLQSQMQIKQAEMQMNAEVKRAEMQMEMQLEREKLEMQREIQMMKLQSDAQMRAQSEMMKPQQMEQDGQQPDRSMDAIALLAQLVEQGSRRSEAGMSQLASIQAAPVTLIRDQNGRPIGAKKDLNDAQIN